MRRDERDEARQGETIAMPDPTYPQSNSPNTTSNTDAQRDEEIARVYRERLDERNRALERWTTRDRVIADMRLVVFLVLVIIGFLLYRGVGISVWWLALAGVVFGA